MTVLTDLPLEVIDAILSHVEPRQLLDVRLCCRGLNAAVQRSPLAQYRLECFASGVEDDLDFGLSYMERLELIRRREERWRTLSPKNRVDINVPFKTSGVYDFTGGVFVLGRKPLGPDRRRTAGYSYFNLPSIGDAGLPASGGVDLGLMERIQSPPCGDTDQPPEAGTSDGRHRYAWADNSMDDEVIDFGLNIYELDLSAVITAYAICYLCRHDADYCVKETRNGSAG